MDQNIIATYGHGTHNDFLIIFDPEGALTVTPEQVAAMCNRESGYGADGVILTPKVDGRWFMDYRNADGSLAEMCGNGIRVMARYLVERGKQPEGIFAIDTRAGIKHLRVPLVDDISVNMGKVYDESEEVTVVANGVTYSGMNINIGNPHAVVFTEDLASVGSLENAPLVTPESSYPDGVNVEFVQIEPGNIAKMRVHERGSGETQSCGTGVCAVALAANIKSGQGLPSRWTVDPPGGSLIVDLDGHSNATLIGPALLIEDVDITSYLDGSRT
jgi:diaminopimelate epimerase